MARQIALLRGVNVGGHRKVPMAELRALMEELGYEDVRTYVQSGNVVFTGPDETPEQAARRIEQGIEAAFGLAGVIVMVRSRDELAGVAAANPLAGVATDPSRYLVSFLDAEVDADRIAALEAGDFAPEAFAVRGREIYVWAPKGLSDSRLVKAVSEKKLGVTATVRNWRTVEKLLALADE
jgi:uncharacterized protein (DUF1697 family)